MEIGASLAQLEIFANDRQASASFYASTFGFIPSSTDGTIACAAPDREVVLVPGDAGQLNRASFRFAERSKFEAHRALLVSAQPRPSSRRLARQLLQRCATPKID